ncbi:hypothetical protein BFS14_02040 [Serratia fonticola]|uniref:hypothetical protein n=1 Tax=Serratia fonticola TaxID=47917 RepID=UPI0008FCFBFB|nr:hypothetical protein [Serratia fonticola]OIX96268.1 hypothetical protein BFS14_02040 [Serratia fonticola]QCR60810.1 hypothetical protein FD644_10730 [Serratia fonticola]
MKSNRAAKRLLEVSIWAYDGAYRLSNRKREFCNEDGEQQVITELSRRQRKRKRKRRVAAIVAWAEGQHTQGERE